MPQPTFHTSDGCPIHYRLRGDGEARIVLIHSLALDASLWDPAADILAREARVLTYDCRGHGRSGRPAGPFTCELFARDLAELLDHLGWPEAAVAGCSLGGCVAQAFAGRFPGRASALGLIDTTAWYGEDAPAAWEQRAAAARAKGFAGMIDFQVTRWFGEEFRAREPEAVARISEVFLKNGLESYAASCQMLGEADLRPYLASFRMPVSVIVGEEDYATPPAMARQLQDCIAGATLTVIPGARHLTPLECPERIAAELAALLRGGRAEGRSV
ncbi:MAG TPA: alpha/beta fold hydrolase [Bryobacteraceae bacterium]|nr:alpha/beta fold hydrolase [Bryobacteraceae bacterium]